MDLPENLKNVRTLIENFIKTLFYQRTNLIDSLLTENLFDYSAEWQQQFLTVTRWSFNQQLAGCEFYRQLCQEKQFDENQLKSFDDILRIPYISTETFKELDLRTQSDDSALLHLTTSGTSGRVSKITLDTVSARRYLYLTVMIYRALGLADSRPCNYLIMSYNIASGTNLASGLAEFIVSQLTPQKGVFHALIANREEKFQLDDAVERLKDYINEGLPIRIVGFPHHTCEVIKSYFSKYGRVKFPEDSYILTAGGWKSFANDYAADFNPWRFLRDTTDIDMKNVRDVYGLTEHGVQYLECELHNKHVPNVAVVAVRNPETMQLVADGEFGLLHLFSPIYQSFPGLSLLTSDIGYIQRDCPCSRGGPYIGIVGRAGAANFVTCAKRASELIEKRGI